MNEAITDAAVDLLLEWRSWRVLVGFGIGGVPAFGLYLAVPDVAAAGLGALFVIAGLICGWLWEMFASG